MIKLSQEMSYPPLPSEIVSLNEINHRVISNLIQAARANARHRLHLNLHSSYEDPCQRLLNAVEPESYIRPHRHVTAGKTETIVALRGRFIFVAFDDSGDIIKVIQLATEMYHQSCQIVLEIQPTIWHTVFSTVPGSVLFEVKSGPYDAHQPKEFASWAPQEGTSDARKYVSIVRQRALSILDNGFRSDLL